MNIINEKMMNKLSFPDFEVIEMVLFQDERKLRISVSGAWLETNGGIMLGKGTLYFNGWESLQINSFDPVAETWAALEEGMHEFLKDLCEVNFSDLTVTLAGFGSETGKWIEWKIIKAKMYAEFE